MPRSIDVRNVLLAAFPAVASRKLLRNLEPVDLTMGETLAEPGDRIRHVYFPITGFVSFLTVEGGHGSELEVGLVGNEGMIGASLVLGVDRAPLRALVQGAGLAWRIEAATFRRELDRSRGTRELLNRYLYVQIVQLAQAAACTRYHVVEARLARWLLMTRDRAHSSKFRITHEFLASMLGVRRVGVTRAATALQRSKLIRYSRGHLEIEDEPGLESAACSCYALDLATYHRAFG